MAMSSCNVQVNIVQPRIEAVCLLSERNSGSSWLARLLEENFELEPFDCPGKHDLGMEHPSSFLALPPSVLVVVNFRHHSLAGPDLLSTKASCFSLSMAELRL